MMRDLFGADHAIVHGVPAEQHFSGWQPPTSFSFRQKPSKGSAICFTATQGRWSEPQNNNETRKTQLTCRSFCCFSFFCPFCLLMSCWHLALPTSSVSACPFPPADTHTAHSKNTGAGENEPTTRHVPSYDVRTRTHLAGGRRPASAATAATSALHSRRRRLDPPDEARDLVVNERHQMQAVALASRARRQPRSSVVGALRWLVAAGALGGGAFR